MKNLLFVFVILLMIIICCANNEKMNSSKFDKKIISITAMELIEELNIDEQTTINDYKNYRIQITGVISEVPMPGPFPIVYDEAGHQMFKNIPISEIIVLGDVEELGWEIFFHFDEKVDRNIHIGDVIAIQGSLGNVERFQSVIAESLHVPMTGEIQYRDVLYIDINDCIIIEVNGMRKHLLPIEGDKGNK
jgi:hypothetical protein